MLSAIYGGTKRKKKETDYPLNALTNRDFFRPPKVSEIDWREYTGWADQLVVIDATDDFCVAAVDVTLRDAAGPVFEYGPAWQSDTEPLWHYCTKTAAPAGPVTFEVVARDLPDNRAELRQTWKPAGLLVPPPTEVIPSPPAVVSDPEIPNYDPRDG